MLILIPLPPPNETTAPDGKLPRLLRRRGRGSSVCMKSSRPAGRSASCKKAGSRAMAAPGTDADKKAF